MNSKITNKPYVIDVMEEIAKERKRLENIVNSREYLQNKRFWGWMEDWLAKSDEEHYKNWHEGKCNICGKKARFFLRMDFSFCEEYGCGLQICNMCLKQMPKIFKNGIKQKANGHHKIL